MRPKETTADFLKRNGIDATDAGHFNVYKVDEFYKNIVSVPVRRDYYKISLVCNVEGNLSYADKDIHIESNALIFGNPLIPYSWQCISEKQTGYFCMFTEEFVHHQLKAESLSESPLFRVNGNPVLFPDKKSMGLLVSVFEQMLEEMHSGYSNKYDLLRNYVQIIIHEALKIEPPVNHYRQKSSSNRITDLFMELLERQFPITSPYHVVQLKNAGEFANQLSIHPNYLTRSLKEVTGKTASEHIADRLLMESKALLLHSNWAVAEIGYCLGFGHASNFNIFFKKQTGQTPNHFRREWLVNHNY